jgi:hypothetical protein
MKRTIVFYLITVPLIFGCHFKSHGDESFSDNEFSNKLIGCYNEDSGVHKIRLFITSPAKESVELSLWSGTDHLITVDTTVSDSAATSIQGNWQSNTDDVSYKFTFYFAPSDTDHIKVAWDSVWAGPAVVKSYTLQRKIFTYSPDWGDYPQASQRLLVDSDVNNVYKEDLEQMRNTIFARHGYCFKDAGWRTVFEYSDWYIPYSTDVMNDLTNIEKKNISLIKKYEKTAKEDIDFNRQ